MHNIYFHGSKYKKMKKKKEKEKTESLFGWNNGLKRS